MISPTADFETKRLRVSEWHVSPAVDGESLDRIVVRILSAPVTRSLPSQWQGNYSLERAQSWIAERGAESSTLVVTDRETSLALGFLILFETQSSTDGADVDLRLGYILAESAWGRGYGTELVAGLVTWCRSEDSVRSLSGGVERDNPASARILVKNGFTAIDGGPGTEQVYELSLKP